jgi:predicted membrane protein (TIGR00267 family)
MLNPRFKSEGTVDRKTKSMDEGVNLHILFFEFGMSWMKEELGLFEERFENSVKLGLIMFVAFIAGGLVPLLPFILVAVPQTSLMTSSTLTFVSLFAIGVWKTTFTSKHWLLSGAEMVLVGILAAVIPYLIGDILLPTILSQITG